MNSVEVILVVGEVRTKCHGVLFFNGIYLLNDIL